MYLRGFRCTQSLSRGPTKFARESSRNRIQWVFHPYRSASSASSWFQRDHTINNGTRKTSSLKPITLFAICIPLGYVVSLISKREGTDADSFVKYTLANKQDVSSTCSIFTLEPTSSSTIRTDDPSLARVITSVQFKQPQLQIARSYTLLPPLENQDPAELRFLIREERNGEVSGYLHRLPVGAELELRGLSAEYVLPEKVDTALFLAGGTGIAPAMQVAKALAAEADVHILWANRKRDDCAGGVSDTQAVVEAKSLSWSNLFGLLSRSVVEQPVVKDQEKNTVVEQLDMLKDASRTASSAGMASLTVDYYVDEEGTFIQPVQVLRLTQRDQSQPRLGRKLLFVAGPDGFINHWAASKIWESGQEVQGPLGGILSRMDLRGWEVVKL